MKGLGVSTPLNEKVVSISFTFHTKQNACDESKEKNLQVLLPQMADLSHCCSHRSSPAAQDNNGCWPCLIPKNFLFVTSHQISRRTVYMKH